MEHKRMTRAAVMLVLLNCALLSAPAEPFQEGAHFFKTNRPQEAIPLLELALKQKDADPLGYIYLALSYSQTDRSAEAIELLKKANDIEGIDKKIVAYNIGNLLFLDEKYGEAEEWYTEAMTLDEKFYLPMLNRANARLRQDKLELSIYDYEKFLASCPEDPQAQSIEQMLALLREEKSARDEAARLATLAAEEAFFAQENKMLEAMRAAERAEAEKALQKKLEEEQKALLAAEDAKKLNAMADEEKKSLAPDEKPVAVESVSDVERPQELAQEAPAISQEKVAVAADEQKRLASIQKEPAAASYESVGSIEKPQELKEERPDDGQERVYDSSDERLLAPEPKEASLEERLYEGDFDKAKGQEAERGQDMERFSAEESLSELSLFSADAGAGDEAEDEFLMAQ